MPTHILIVDDERNLTYTLRDMLIHLDQSYHISVASSGYEALDVLKDQPVDLLVTDLRMPGINGLELIRRARALNPQIRTILMTIYSNERVEAEARHLGIGRVVAKPFRMAELVGVIRDALTDERASDVAIVGGEDDLVGNYLDRRR